MVLQLQEGRMLRSFLMQEPSNMATMNTAEVVTMAMRMTSSTLPHVDWLFELNELLEVLTSKACCHASW